VTVAAYGADEFPAFFTRHSGCRAPARVDTAETAAAMIRHNVELGLGSGAVIGEFLDLHCQLCAYLLPQSQQHRDAHIAMILYLGKR